VIPSKTKNYLILLTPHSSACSKPAAKCIRNDFPLKLVYKFCPLMHNLLSTLNSKIKSHISNSSKTFILSLFLFCSFFTKISTRVEKFYVFLNLKKREKASFSIWIAKSSYDFYGFFS